MSLNLKQYNGSNLDESSADLFTKIRQELGTTISTGNLYEDLLAILGAIRMLKQKSPTDSMIPRFTANVKYEENFEFLFLFHLLALEL
ncbi:5135_t:CDS:2 [Cetraspora pellucida]|uniref:5135_t:CDS:1 n=1 Tax=Cetraspora pellucida TaxID=1433469 RepID=A0ACA9KT77_9GLOM|nr:5135_t:CDS:2 [Cetraspora pellucida]